MGGRRARASTSGRATRWLSKDHHPVCVCVGGGGEDRPLTIMLAPPDDTLASPLSQRNTRSRPSNAQNLRYPTYTFPHDLQKTTTHTTNEFTADLGVRFWSQPCPLHGWLACPSPLPRVCGPFPTETPWSLLMPRPALGTGADLTQALTPSPWQVPSAATHTFQNRGPFHPAHTPRYPSPSPAPSMLPCKISIGRCGGACLVVRSATGGTPFTPCSFFFSCPEVCPTSKWAVFVFCVRPV